MSQYLVAFVSRGVTGARRYRWQAELRSVLASDGIYAL